jgi:hypothetical protein
MKPGREKRCGNGGAVESMENHTPVFHPSHNSLEISQTPRDSHIPTAAATVSFSLKTKIKERKSAAARPPHPHSFMIILHWNQKPLS